MTLSPGTKLGTYEILGLLGVGGMGEVYRARDAKLKREVALKVLPDGFARDVGRLERFQREAEILASLNHPHIAAIHDLAEVDGTPYLILELVEGQTLADRIARGPIPLVEAFPIAGQIAEALEAAHDKGIIHRDLKPANIKITPGASVKVLDFGLAKTRDDDDAGRDPSESPTLMATMPGIIIGTAAYMSPEQAKGQPADRTSDIWAFGCVFYEMLTRHRLFEGDTASEMLAGVLKNDPDWRRLPASTPDAVRLVLRRCLQKDRRLRFHDMADVRILLDEAQSAPPSQELLAPRTAGRHIPWIAVALALVAAAAGVAWVIRPKPAPVEMRVDITTPPTSSPASFAIAPDGLKIAFVATSGNQPGLWLRSLDAVSARPLAQTEGAEFPFWAPDSQSIGFFADRKLKRFDVANGSVQTLADAAPLGGSWNRDGTILFVGGYGDPISRMSAAGGAPVAVTRLEQYGHTAHRSPHFLPDGRRFLYVAHGSPETSGVHVGRLEDADSHRLLEAAGAVYTRAGHLLFVRDGTLFAQRFDTERLALAGESYLIAEHIEDETGGILPLSASAAGPIAYRSTVGQRQLVWFDRSGGTVARVGDPFNGGSIELSPDGRRVALHRVSRGRNGIWLLETQRGVFSEITSEGPQGLIAIWSPDGSRVVLGMVDKGELSLFQKRTDSTDRAEPLPTSHAAVPQDWSSDGRFLLYAAIAKNDVDLWAMPLDGDGKPLVVAHTAGDERLGQFSPDGKWVAYMSNESGRFEIHVQPFPGPGRKSQISLGGGAQPRWRRDGKELFYVALDGRLMAVPIRLGPGAQTLEAGAAVPLFMTAIGGALTGVEKHQYTVAPDGQRFLMNTVVEDAGTSRITVVLNWKPKN